MLVKPHEVYFNQMIEVKWRLKAALRILGAKKPLTLNLDADNESAMLQVRKIVELITFSAIVADEQRYQRSREIEAQSNQRDHGNYTLDWKAPDILQRLAKISPYFLPRPIGPLVTVEDGMAHFSEGKAKINHDRLIEIYKATGGYLHISNPYKINASDGEKKKRTEARAMLAKEISWLESVIWNHGKIGLAWDPNSDPNKLDKPDQAWIVSFGPKETDQIRMTLAAAVPDRDPG